MLRTVRPVAYSNVNDVKMPSEPSVTMNGGSLIRVISRPLNAPARPPTTMPMIKDAHPGTPWSNAVLAITIDENTMIAPQERSIPAVRMISVWPIARVPTTAVCWAITPRSVGVANFDESSRKMMTVIARTIAGLSHG